MERTVAQVAEALLVDETTALDYFKKSLDDDAVDASTCMSEDQVAGLAAQENERRGVDPVEIVRCPGCLRWFDFHNVDNIWGDKALCDHCFDQRALAAEFGGFGALEPIGAEESLADEEDADVNELWGF